MFMSAAAMIPFRTINSQHFRFQNGFNFSLSSLFSLICFSSAPFLDHCSLIPISIQEVNIFSSMKLKCNIHLFWHLLHQERTIIRFILRPLYPSFIPCFRIGLDISMPSQNCVSNSTVMEIAQLYLLFYLACLIIHKTRTYPSITSLPATTNPIRQRKLDLIS